MRTETFFCVVATLIAVGPSAASPVDEIKYNQTRPLMNLAGELQDRYGYLVTYEDAPLPKEAIFTEKRRVGPDYSYPAWKPVTFHVDARQPAEPDTSGLPQSTASDTPRPVGRIRPLGPSVIDPLVEEYNSSGNPGQFKVIYEGDYAHIVPAGLVQDGKLVAFQPILSTEVFVNLQEGTCWDVFNGLVDEVQQVRNVKIMLWESQTRPWDPKRCSISGHNLAARNALIQMLDQMGQDPTFPRAPKVRYVWTCVYEPTTEQYFLTISYLSPEEPQARPEAATPQSPGPGAASSSDLLNRLMTAPVRPPVPATKKK